MELEKFDLEKAKAGRKVVTREGNPVEILKWDARGKNPLVGISKTNKEDYAKSWEIDGQYYSANGESEYDLFLAPEERYVNEFVYGIAGSIYHSLEDATNAAKTLNGFTGTYKLTKV